MADICCSTAVLNLRDNSGDESSVRVGNARTDCVLDAQPWRRFRWYRGQQHYSGSYWSTTESGHVIYESRLELSRLLLADFNPGVRRIKAQPCLMQAEVDGRVRRHVPDYWLLTAAGPVLVEVKPASLLDDPKVAFTFGWVRQVAQALGWGFEVASEPSAALSENLRFIAGFRRRDWINAEVLEALRCAELDGVRFGDAAGLVAAKEPLVRSALLHMLWTGELRTDFETVLSCNSILRTRPAS